MPGNSGIHPSTSSGGAEAMPGNSGIHPSTSSGGAEVIPGNRTELAKLSFSTVPFPLGNPGKRKFPDPGSGCRLWGFDIGDRARRLCGE